ncbi:MAG: cytochrome c peroxidase [Acetobacteraceae bacterium]|nr:cytochrome c peroxidase [Acetobacteraceae bacterium]
MVNRQLIFVIAKSGIPLCTNAAIVAGTLALPATARADTCPGYTVCPIINFQDALTNDPDVRKVNAGITRIETQTLNKILKGQYSQDPASPNSAKSILGEVMIYDRNLSVNGLVACATCHRAQEGFTGGASLFNNTTVSYAGAIGDRASGRKPMSYSYAPFAPILFYRSSTGDFVGGNFWDERATGLVTGNPAADQALGPPLNPVEMANPDAACVTYHLSQSAYRYLFEQVWGAQSFAITWPADTAQLCAEPAGSTTSASSTVVPLSIADRDQAITTFHNMGLAMATYEVGPDVSSFSSKYDFVQRQQATFTPTEQEGFQLFTGQANCNQCHVTTNSPPVTTSQPLFTDFTAVSLGIPENTEIPYYTENAPDTYGYTANPEGPNYRDEGVGAILATSGNAEWAALAPKFFGTFQVATLRNVDKRQRSTFVKGYMHNGYFKTLEEVVHFYNTRDVLPTCPAALGTAIGAPVGTTCWPAPEVPTNINHTQTGNLGLTHDQELAIVAFLKTLSDGYVPPTVTQ